MKRLSLGCGAFALVMVVPFVALAQNWTVGHGSGECYFNNNRVGGAQYCHNCTTKQQGNNVRWTFTLNCDGRPTAKQSTPILNCNTAPNDEGAQLRALIAMVRLPTKAKCP